MTQNGTWSRRSIFNEHVLIEQIIQNIFAVVVVRSFFPSFSILCPLLSFLCSFFFFIFTIKFYFKHMKCTCSMNRESRINIENDRYYYYYYNYVSNFIAKYVGTTMIFFCNYTQFTDKTFNKMYSFSFLILFYRL